ncbi:putative N-acetyltransferase [Acrodontium crateriforme]|uniref:N-alpha-acetyltransferase 40 n=1 Tax=Acrodontium crateriforme TaxID=150365 RepID=A0AAQ3R1S6_9PEZI|nr:putative N-acetyltransferase [Acrodontium crateriforme]
MAMSKEAMLEKPTKRKACEMLESSEQPSPNTMDKSPQGQEKNRPTKRLAKADSKAIKVANNLSTLAFKNAFIPSENLVYRTTKRAKQASTTAAPPQVFNIIFHEASELTKNQMYQCFNLIESTSRSDYESCATFGWHPRRKRREMSEDEMRYLLVYSNSSSPNPPKGCDNADNQTAHDEDNDQAKIQDGNLVAFLSFMLTHDSTPCVPVLYIYEIHTWPLTRGIGLGQHLMHLAETIARNVGVQKVMLTCFMRNTKAMGFYESMGFSKDVCSPEERVTRGRTVEVEYVIMSKEISAR